MDALVPPEDASGEGEVLDESPSSSSFDLPFADLANRAAEQGETVTETVDGPEGQMLRVVNIPVIGRDGDMTVVQARSRAGWSVRRWDASCSSWSPSVLWASY